jgi:predicted Zn-dependent protease with MMP-like domain/Flp pilus assembly protein TadD
VHSIETLLDEAGNALEDERFEDALAKSDAVLERQPDDLEALGLKAAALAELGRWEEADPAYARLIALEPGEPTWQLAAADVMIRQPGDDLERAEAGLALLEKIERQAEKDPRLHFDWLLLSGIALNQLGELEDALAALEAATNLFPDELEPQLERALVLFELARFKEAEAAFLSVANEDPENPWPPHCLGLLAERSGDDAQAAALFARATRLDPEAFPVPVKLSAEEFDAALGVAIAKLPDHARAQLGNVTISVQPFPDDESLRSGEVTPTILGVFQGTPLDERSPIRAEDHQTATIVLYQRNLERFARTREELIEQIEVTVLHEVGHLLGLDEDELYERGLD